MGVAESISAISGAAQALFTFLATAEGQKTVAQWRNDSIAWNQAVKQAGAWLEALLKG